MKFFCTLTKFSFLSVSSIQSTCNILSTRTLLAHCFWAKDGGFQIGALCSPYKNGKNCNQKVERFGIAQVFDHPGKVFDVDNTI